MVPGTGFEPVIFAVRGRCPRPLDEPGTHERTPSYRKRDYAIRSMRTVLPAAGDPYTHRRANASQAKGPRQPARFIADVERSRLVSPAGELPPIRTSLRAKVQSAVSLGCELAYLSFPQRNPWLEFRSPCVVPGDSTCADKPFPSDADNFPKSNRGKAEAPDFAPIVGRGKG